MRRAWLGAGSVAAVGFLVLGSLQAIGLLARTDRTVRERFDADGLTVVDVTSDDGDVRVIGDEETTVRVVIRVRESWRKVERESKVEGDRLVLSAECPAFGAPICSADYEVHVPPGIRVVARSDNGDVTVDGVEAGSTLVSSNGDVTGNDLGGTVSFETDNGTVEGTDLAGDAVTARSSNGDVGIALLVEPTTATATSDNGDVEVVLPRGTAMYAVDATTDNGESATPIRTDPDSRRRVVARSDNGDVVIRYP